MPAKIANMKKIFFLFICAAALSCGEDVPENGTARLLDTSNFTTIEWLDTAQTFGTVKQGEVVTMEFKCRNTGDKNLYIVSAQPSCGCTLADYTKEPIKPGQMGRVVAQFDTKKGHPGVVRKTISVRTNNQNHTVPNLIFTGTIIADSTAVHENADSAATQDKANSPAIRKSDSSFTLK